MDALTQLDPVDPLDAMPQDLESPSESNSMPRKPLDYIAKFVSLTRLGWVAGAIVLMILTAAGWSLRTPASAITDLRQQIVRLDTTRETQSRLRDAEIARLELRVDSLHSDAVFTKYMLCTLVRKVDPQSAPLDCPTVYSPHQ